MGEFAWAAEVRLPATGEYVGHTSPVVDADPEPIRELRSLRVLTLNAAQARRLVEAGGPVPGPAGFYLTGNVSLRDAFELPHALSGGGIAPTLTEFSGTLR